MTHAKLLDCTLRDGAYLIDKNFGEDNIVGITAGLVKSKVDFIEIGFFQNEGFGEGKTVYLNSADASRFVPQDKGGSKFTVLADCSRYDVKNLDDCRLDSIDAVRECFFKQEREQAMENCRVIKSKGYLCFVQPVDIMGYTDKELLNLIDEINEIEPYCISIVDTFGSMYQEDLHRLVELLHHNLAPSIKVGFHSHNNMQLSNALSQEFLRLMTGKREVVIDGTLSGMGRGAGNTPTELIAQYMVSKMHAGYDMDAILDVLDTYMDNIRTRCTWGYNTPYFIAGCYSAHVNNIAFLTAKNSIRSKDIRYILNKVGAVARKRYDYDLLEKTYVEYLSANIDDEAAIAGLTEIVRGKKVLILAPGNTLKTHEKEINKFIKENNPVIISVNVIPDEIKADFLYMSNLKRYEYLSKTKEFSKIKKIVTSNLPENVINEVFRVSFTKFVRLGYEHMDNSCLMLLWMLDVMKPGGVYFAGFDGYEPHQENNYYSKSLELSTARDNAVAINTEIIEMLNDYIGNRRNKNIQITFITPSRFDKVDGMLSAGESLLN